MICKEISLEKSNTRRGESSNNQKTYELMCFKCRKPEHIKVNYHLLNKYKKKRKATCAKWDEIVKSESNEDSRQQKECLSCFRALSNKVKVNCKLNISIDKFGTPYYHELAHASDKFGT